MELPADRPPAGRDPPGIAYLTEDRKGWGLFLGMSLRENVIAPSLRRFTTGLDILNRSQIDRFAGRKSEPTTSRPHRSTRKCSTCRAATSRNAWWRCGWASIRR